MTATPDPDQRPLQPPVQLPSTPTYQQLEQQYRAGYPQPIDPRFATQHLAPQAYDPRLGFAVYPSPPAWTAAARPPMPARPGTVLAAIVVQAATVLVGIFTVFALINSAEFARGVAVGLEQNNIDPSQADQLTRVSTTLVLVVALGFYAAMILFILKLAQGRNWARVVITVFSSISLAFGLLAMSLGGAPTGLSLLGLAAEAATLILLYRKVSNDYFAGVKAARGK